MNAISLEPFIWINSFRDDPNKKYCIPSGMHVICTIYISPGMVCQVFSLYKLRVSNGRLGGEDVFKKGNI
jgi:hypothetical protein